MMIPVTALADDPGILFAVGDACSKLKADCQAAVSAADKVIEQQDAEIEFIKARNDDLFRSQSALQAALEQDQSKIESQQKTEVLVGILGVAVGALAYGLLAHRP